MTQQPLVGQGLVIIEASRSHSDTPHSVGLLWKSDQPDARDLSLPDNTQHSQETDIHASGGIRTHNPSKRAAVDPRLTPRGQWDRRLVEVAFDIFRDMQRSYLLTVNSGTCSGFELSVNET
jgi:hypothetical protein